MNSDSIRPIPNPDDIPTVPDLTSPPDSEEEGIYDPELADSGDLEEDL